MSKFVNKKDLEKLFGPVSRSLHFSFLSFSLLRLFRNLNVNVSRFGWDQFGKIKDIRMTLDKDGHTVGAAFVEYEDVVRSPFISSFHLPTRSFSVSDSADNEILPALRSR
jgi:hypothetical protein